MPAILKQMLAILFTLGLCACGSLVDMGGNSSGSQRRVYVNDAAPNDSLRSALQKGGVYFVLQPGKKYSFQVEGAVAGEYLQLLAASGKVYNFWKNVAGDGLQGTTQTFTIQDSTATSANFVLAFLRTSAGGIGTLPAKVKLRPTNPGLPSTMKVRLVFVRTLTGLPSTGSKDFFASRFLAELDSTYATHGIDLETSYEIVEHGSPAFTADFSSPTTFPGGTRIANTVYMYLVDRITIDGESNPDGVILGFAPREAFDLGSAEIVLSVENGSQPLPIAITAAHELGHFLGLRHTTATELDRRGDDDLSNFEDGFTGTAVCAGLPKRMATPANLRNIRMPGGQHYCLRTAAELCPNSCLDKTNLMFAYKCDDVVQKTLVSEQSTFIRQNLSLFQR